MVFIMISILGDSSLLADDPRKLHKFECGKIARETNEEVQCLNRFTRVQTGKILHQKMLQINPHLPKAGVYHYYRCEPCLPFLRLVSTSRSSWMAKILVPISDPELRMAVVE